jgi:Arc/MetJ-type ribon-helix-helix transcriptional regulator
MSVSKERLTVTVDPDLVEAASAAVAEGRVGSLSAWVNLALSERAAKERRLRALAGAIAAYEKEFGPISAEEISTQARADREAARVVRGSRRSTKAPRPARGRAR